MGNTYVITRDDELQHHGTKGMKWGVRLYQNKDGSLTPLGQKRYNKEVENLKKEKAKLAAEKKAVSTAKKNQAKLDKLEADKKKLADQKKALEEEKKKLKSGERDEKDDAPQETLAEARARLLKSTDPKEIYAERDKLTYNELNERVNRINLEQSLSGKIPADPVEPSKLDTANARMKRAKETIDNVTGVYKSVDDAVTTVANSTIGKTLADMLGVEIPKKEKTFDLDDFYKNINKKSHQEVKDVAERVKNTRTIRDEVDPKDNKDGTGKQQSTKANAEKQSAGNNKSDSGDNSGDSTNTSKTDTKSNKEPDAEKVSGTVEGKGTSRRSDKVNDTVIDAEWRDVEVSSVPATTTSAGRNAVAGLLEEKK